MQARRYWGHGQTNLLENDLSQGERTRNTSAPFLPWSSDSFHERISEMLSAFTTKLTFFDLGNTNQRSHCTFTGSVRLSAASAKNNKSGTRPGNASLKRE